MWLAIGPNGISKPLIKGSNFAINKEVYLEECIKKRLIPYIRANYDDDYVFWPDKASSHYANIVVNHLRGEEIEFVQKEDNPANVSEARSIEDFWSILKGRVYANAWRAENTRQLINRIKLCLRQMDKDLVQRLAADTKKRNSKKRALPIFGLSIYEMKEKSVELGNGDVDNPLSGMNVRRMFREVSDPSVDDVLINELLVLIFKLLSPADRMRVELVSKKWSRLLRKFGWNNYNVVSSKQFPGCNHWKDAYSKFKSLFLRCGKFVKELDFSNQRVKIPILSEDICVLLPMLPNLRHLSLCGVTVSNDAFMLISDTFPCLISFGFLCETSEIFDGVTAVLKKCKRLEILQMHGRKMSNRSAYHFSVLPPGLKYVYIGRVFDCRTFFLQLVVHGIQLESLEFQIFPLLLSKVSMLRMISFAKIRYLAFDMNQGLLDHFLYLAVNLRHLQALELDLYGNTNELWTDELFEEILTKCLSLKHFGLRVFAYIPIRAEMLGLLASLPKLCSVQLIMLNSAISVPVSFLFGELSLTGQLQCFHTDQVLSAESVCQALVRCKNLTRIFCGQTGQEKDFYQLLTTLDKIHQAEQPPASAVDERILHTNFGSRNNKNVPLNPWVKFYSTDEHVPSNKIGEQICFGGVSSKPSFAQFW